MGFSLGWGTCTCLLMFHRSFADTIHHALANSVSKNMLVPVPFSFGWMGYIVGKRSDAGRLPVPELPGVVINAQDGYAQPNHSWVIDRLIHGYPVIRGLEKNNYAMSVSIVKTKGEGDQHSDPRQCDDLGWAVILLQVLVTSIPGICYGNWNPLLLFLACNWMCVLYSYKWKQNGEKHAGRMLQPNEKRTVVLTSGNDSKHALVVISDGTGLDLEEFARTQIKDSEFDDATKEFHAILWILLLGGLWLGGAWIFSAACVGMFHNHKVARTVSTPESLGLHLEHLADVVPDNANDIMSVIKKLEEYEDKNVGLDRNKPSLLDGAGIAMIPTFFPNGISDEDNGWVATRKRLYGILKFEEENDLVKIESD